MFAPARRSAAFQHAGVFPAYRRQACLVSVLPNFHGSSLPNEALAQAGAPSEHGASIAVLQGKAKSDRSSIIGTAIPSGVIVTVIDGRAVSYVGVGGGVYSPRLANTSSLVPLNWRIVF